MLSCGLPLCHPKQLWQPTWSVLPWGLLLSGRQPLLLHYRLPEQCLWGFCQGDSAACWPARRGASQKPQQTLNSAKGVHVFDCCAARDCEELLVFLNGLNVQMAEMEKPAGSSKGRDMLTPWLCAESDAPECDPLKSQIFSIFQFQCVFQIV